MNTVKDLIITFDELLKEYDDALEVMAERIDSIYKSYHGASLPYTFRLSTLRHFLIHLPYLDVDSAMRRAIEKTDGTWNSALNCRKYFCGICWGMMKK